MTSARFHSIDLADGSRVMFATIAGQRAITIAPRTRSAVANVVMIHGLGDYPARYVQHGRRLASRGYRVILPELAGHGGHAAEWSRTLPIYEIYARADRSADVLRSFRIGPRPTTADRREIGARQYSRLERTRVTEHLTQISTMLRHLGEATGDSRALPLFLAGHSLGGLLAHETAWRMQPADRAALAGVVLVAPALRPQGSPDSRLMQAAVNGLWALRRLPVSPTRAAFKALLGLNLGVDTTWGKKWVSDVTEEVDLYDIDPLIPHRMPTRYASSIESLMVESARRNGPPPYDGLVLVPKVDGITSRDAAIGFSRRANAGGASRIDLIEFDVVAHDILRSSSGPRALSSLIDWLDARLQIPANRRLEQRTAS